MQKRLARWTTSGVGEQVFRPLVRDANNAYLMIDSTLVRAHQQAARGRKKGDPDPALGRSRGGLTTKIHLLSNALGQPWDFVVTAGQVADCTQALP